MKRRVLLVDSVGDVGGAELIIPDTRRLREPDRWAPLVLVPLPPGANSGEATPIPSPSIMPH